MHNLQRVQEKILAITPDIVLLVKDELSKLVTVSQQLSQDICTNIDHRVGQYIFQQIRQIDPTIAMDSEEVEERIGSSNIKVRIDPIDGTKHMAAGIPLFVSSIALKVKEETVFALVINHQNGDHYYANNGSGAFKNNKPIIVNTIPIEESFVFIEHPTSKLLSKDHANFSRNWGYSKLIQEKAFRTRNIGLSALALCLVASGSASLFIDLSGTTKLYDVEAGIFIAHQAGALILDIAGNNLGNNLAHDLNSEKKELITNYLVGNPLAAKEVVGLLKT